MSLLNPCLTLILSSVCAFLPNLKFPDQKIERCKELEPVDCRHKPCAVHDHSVQLLMTFLDPADSSPVRSCTHILNNSVMDNGNPMPRQYSGALEMLVTVS